MSVLNEIVEHGFDLYQFLSQKSKASNITKRLIFRELKNNMQLLEHRNKKEVDRLKLIEKLENSSLVAAIKEGFDLSKLASKQRIDDPIVDHIPASKKYLGWDAEQLVLSIDEKITALKDITEIFQNTTKVPINTTQRLNNLFLLCVLLTLLSKRATD